MIKTKKDFSYGIIAIVAIVAIVTLFNLSSTKVITTTESTIEESSDLGGEAFKKFVEWFKKVQRCDVSNFANTLIKQMQNNPNSDAKKIINIMNGYNCQKLGKDNTIVELNTFLYELNKKQNTLNNFQDSTCENGDMNNDGVYDVLDIVLLVQCALGGNCEENQGDLNDDGVYDVLDIVSLVQCALSEDEISPEIHGNMQGEEFDGTMVVTTQISIIDDSNITYFDAKLIGPSGTFEVYYYNYDDCFYDTFEYFEWRCYITISLSDGYGTYWIGVNATDENGNHGSYFNTTFFEAPTPIFHVTSTPSAATTYVSSGGIYSTPFTIGVPSGEYSFNFTKEGFYDFVTEEITVNNGDEIYIHADLIPLSSCDEDTLICCNINDPSRSGFLSYFDFDFCHGPNEGTNFNFSDYYGDDASNEGVISLIIRSATWCGPCFEESGTIDQLYANYINEPRVKIIEILDDEWQPYSCSQWGNGGEQSEFPDIATGDDISSDIKGALIPFVNDVYPSYYIIDEDGTYITAGNVVNISVAQYVIDGLLADDITCEVHEWISS